MVTGRFFSDIRFGYETARSIKIAEIPSKNWTKKLVRSRRDFLMKLNQSQKCIWFGNTSKATPRYMKQSECLDAENENLKCMP